MPPEIIPRKRLRARLAALLAADDANARHNFVTSRREALSLGFEGIRGDRHAGWTRPADARTPYHPRGTAIRNTRHLSLVSAEELGAVAAAMGLPELLPEWLGANIVLEGLELLSFLPTGTRLFFPDGATIVAEGYNPPCIGPGKVIADAAAGANPQAFIKAAARRRGIVASVERPGHITTGAEVVVVTPEQWLY